MHLRNDARTIIGERSAHAQWRTVTYIHILDIRISANASRRLQLEAAACQTFAVYQENYGDPLQVQVTRNATALGSLIRPRAVTRCNLAVSDMYMRDFGKTHQIAYTYCSVGISDLKPLTGTSADQLPHRKS